MQFFNDSTPFTIASTLSVFFTLFMATVTSECDSLAIHTSPKALLFKPPIQPLPPSNSPNRFVIVFSHDFYALSEIKLNCDTGMHCRFLDYSVDETLFHDEISSMQGRKGRVIAGVKGTCGGNSFGIIVYVIWGHCLWLLWGNQNQNRIASLNGFASIGNGMLFW